MRELPYHAAEQCGVFTTAQARRAGWTTTALRHAVRSGRLVRLRIGAYQDASLDGLNQFERARWRHAAPAIAAVLTTPGALASHSTSAVARGIPLLFIPMRPCVSVVPWHTGEISRVHVHRCTAAPLTLPAGYVPCTSIERTLIDLAREHGATAGVVSLDYALHEQLTDLSRLYTELDRCVRWPGVRAAREAIRLADARSESPLESRSRLKIPEFGLAAPEPQVSIGNESGGFVGRVDFYWDEFGVVGEVDGAVKYDDEQDRPLHKEKLRQEALENLGLEVVRWGATELRDFDAVAARLRRAFARGAKPGSQDRRWTVLVRDFDPVSDTARRR